VLLGAHPARRSGDGRGAEGSPPRAAQRNQSFPSPYCTRVHIATAPASLSSPLGPDGAKALAGVKWERLEWLELYFALIDARWADALAASPHLGRLTHLDLSHNPLGPDGVRAIARSPHLGGLRCLRLEHTGADVRGLAEPRERFGRQGWTGETFSRPVDEAQ
jgi:Leucine Rich repeat